MVRQVKKYIISLAAVLITAAAICGSVSAATYSTYSGNLSTTQLTYFRDALSGISIVDNYVVFRDDQNSYKMVVGNLEYNNEVFTSNESCRLYSLNNGSGTNNYYTYDYSTISDFKLTTNGRIVYSDLGGFPQLEERGQRYEILQTILICVACLCVVIRSIFNSSRR